jgi:hypothetical protein
MVSFMAMSLTTIYVRLLEEGTDVWRPVHAERQSENTYRISSANADPENETWEFRAGEVVICEEKVFEENQRSLVAIRKA